MSDETSDDIPRVMPYKDLVHAMFEQAKDADSTESELADVPDHIVELHRKEFDNIRSTLGTTIPEIVAKGDSVGWDVVHSALTTIISWKSWNNIDLTFTEGMIAGYMALYCDVNNGGFHQYFFNSAGDHWRNVLQILVDGGDKDGERRFRELLSIFPNGEPSADRGERWEQLEQIENEDEDAMWDHFDKFSDEFYDHPYPTDDTFWAAIKPRQDDIKPVWI